ncbi:unnamed protein product, partial [marine sediment metagenome]
MVIIISWLVISRNRALETELNKLREADAPIELKDLMLSEV